MTKTNFIISVLTVFVQYYDYHLFGFMAANISTYFFPVDEVVTQLLNTYLVMSIAMVAKPIGSIVLGKIGDLKGRSNSFKISLIGTAIASFVLFATPSYQQIGGLACASLLICRMAICTFVTGGSDGVRIYIYEHISEKNKCLGVGFTTIFTLAGSLSASLSAWYFTLNNETSLVWRYSFLIGSILSLIVIIAMKITDFKDNIKVMDSDDYHKYSSISFYKIIKENWKLFLTCTILAGSIGSTTQFLIVFFGTYNYEILATESRHYIQKIITLGIVSYMIFSVIGGYIADKIGRLKTTLLSGALLLIILVVLCAYTSKMQFSAYVFIAINCVIPFVLMPAAVIFKQSIPMPIRYRLFSLSHAVGSVLISAPTAYVSTYLYKVSGVTWLPILYFISAIFMICLSVYILSRKNVTS